MVEKLNIYHNFIVLENINLSNQLDCILDSNDKKPKLLFFILILKLLKTIFVKDKEFLINNKNINFIFRGQSNL